MSKSNLGVLAALASMALANSVNAGTFLPLSTNFHAVGVLTLTETVTPFHTLTCRAHVAGRVHANGKAFINVFLLSGASSKCAMETASVPWIATAPGPAPMVATIPGAGISGPVSCPAATVG
jgi:hypothetical protein